MIQLELPGMITDPAQFFKDQYLCQFQCEAHNPLFKCEAYNPVFKCEAAPRFVQRDADYSALEARVYAEIAKDGRLRNYLSEYWPTPYQLELPLESCGSQS